MSQLLTPSMVDEDRVVETLITCCRIDSAPLKERAMFLWVKERLERLGYTVEEDDAGVRLGGEVGNLIATKPGRDALRDAPAIMLLAHLDRVVGGIGVRPTVRDGSVYSDGTTILGADDAAGIAAILEACTVFAESGSPHPPIELVLTIGEEIGLVGAKEVDAGRLKARIGYVLDADGPVGTVITQAPTQYGLRAVFHGKAAHAGVAPERGVSAVKIAAAAVSMMPLGRIDDETTANVGYIAGGGPTNIVPDHAEIRAEARSLDREKAERQIERMVAAAAEAAQRHGGAHECEVSRPYEGFHLDADSAVVRRAFAAARGIGLTPETRKTGGGSDANIFNAKGIATAVLGVGYQSIHTYQEHMPIDQLVQLARLVCAIKEVAEP